MNELTYCIISSICSTLALVLLGLVGKIQPSLCHEKNISFLHIKIFVSGYGIWKVWNSQTSQIPYEYYAIFTQLQYYLTSMSNAKLDIFGILFPCIYPLFRKSVLENHETKEIKLRYVNHTFDWRMINQTYQQQQKQRCRRKEQFQLFWLKYCCFFPFTVAVFFCCLLRVTTPLSFSCFLYYLTDFVVLSFFYCYSLKNKCRHNCVLHYYCIVQQYIQGDFSRVDIFTTFLYGCIGCYAIYVCPDKTHLPMAAHEMIDDFGGNLVNLCVSHGVTKYLFIRIFYAILACILAKY